MALVFVALFFLVGSAEAVGDSNAVTTEVGGSNASGQSPNVGGQSLHVDGQSPNVAGQSLHVGGQSPQSPHVGGHSPHLPAALGGLDLRYTTWHPMILAQASPALGSRRTFGITLMDAEVVHDAHDNYPYMICTWREYRRTPNGTLPDRRTQADDAPYARPSLGALRGISQVFPHQPSDHLQESFTRSPRDHHEKGGDQGTSSASRKGTSSSKGHEKGNGKRK